MMTFRYPQLGETVYRHTLPNGLNVFIVPKPEHVRSYAFFATRYGGMDMRFRRNGEWLDTPAGIAHYLEHKMFDTEEGNAMQDLAQNGAEPNAFTSNAMTAYYFDSTECFEENLRILLSFVSIPYFTEESVCKERGIIAQEIGMIEDNPEWQVYVKLMECLYRRSPARISVAGSVESIGKITAQTLYDCHKAFYTPANMALVVVGPVEPERILKIAEEVLPKQSEPEVERDYGEEEDGTVHQKRSVISMEVSMPIFLAGWQCQPPQLGEAYLRQSIIGDLACDILLGESSPLYARLYDRRLINGSFGGSYEMLPNAAYLYAGGDSNEPEAVFAAISEEAQRLASEGIDEELYQRIRKSTLGHNLRALNSFETIAMTLVDGCFHRYDGFRFREVFDTITKADVEDFLRENIVPRRSAISIVEPKELRI